VAEDEAPPARKFAPDVPRDLETICKHCLAKEPRDRYPTAAALADDLAKFLNGDPVTGSRWSVLDRVRSNLEYTRWTGELLPYAAACYWFAGVMLAVEAVIYLCIAGDLPHGLIRLANGCRVAILIGLVLYTRRRRLGTSGAAERYFWSVWTGFLVCNYFNWLSHRLWMGWDVAFEVRLYQSVALLSAMAFFSLGSVVWGWCFAFGAAFIGVALLMAADLTLAPIEFGITWAVVLVIVGRRIQIKQREAAARLKPTGGP
jgi:eukaryotic-like serine/threonine-protein kinase